MAHEIQHALGGDEREAYEVMVRFLVRHGLNVATDIRNDIANNFTGMGASGRNLLLEMVDGVINEMRLSGNEYEILKTLRGERQERKIGSFSYGSGLEKLDSLLRENLGRKILILINGNQHSGKTRLRNELLKEVYRDKDVVAVDEDKYQLSQGAQFSVNGQSIQVKEEIENQLRKHDMVIYDGINSYKIFTNVLDKYFKGDDLEVINITLSRKNSVNKKPDMYLSVLDESGYEEKDVITPLVEVSEQLSAWDSDGSRYMAGMMTEGPGKFLRTLFMIASVFIASDLSAQDTAKADTLFFESLEKSYSTIFNDGRRYRQSHLRSIREYFSEALTDQISILDNLGFGGFRNNYALGVDRFYPKMGYTKIGSDSLWIAKGFFRVSNLLDSNSLNLKCLVYLIYMHERIHKESEGNSGIDDLVSKYLSIYEGMTQVFTYKGVIEHLYHKEGLRGPSVDIVAESYVHGMNIGWLLMNIVGYDIFKEGYETDLSVIIDKLKELGLSLDLFEEYADTGTSPERRQDILAAILTVAEKHNPELIQIMDEDRDSYNFLRHFMPEIRKASASYRKTQNSLLIEQFKDSLQTGTIGKFEEDKNKSVGIKNGRLAGRLINIDTGEEIDFSNIEQRRIPRIGDEMRGYIQNIERLMDRYPESGRKDLLRDVLDKFKNDLPHHIIITNAADKGFFGIGKGKEKIFVTDESLVDDPVAFLHEILEYTVSSNPSLEAKLKASLSNSAISWVERHRQKYIDLGMSDYFDKNETHYIIRACTRQVFLKDDKRTTDKIKRYTEITNDEERRSLIRDLKVNLGVEDASSVQLAEEFILRDSSGANYFVLDFISETLGKPHKTGSELLAYELGKDRVPTTEIKVVSVDNIDSSVLQDWARSRGLEYLTLTRIVTDYKGGENIRKRLTGDGVESLIVFYTFLRDNDHEFGVRNSYWDKDSGTVISFDNEYSAMVHPGVVEDISIDDFIQSCNWNDIFKQYDVNYDVLREKVAEFMAITDEEIERSVYIGGFTGELGAAKIAALKRWRDNLDKDLELLIKDATGKKVNMSQMEGPQTGEPGSAQRKKFYKNLAISVNEYLKNSGALCMRHSALIVEELYRKYGIKSVVMEKELGDGAHYWVQTEDGFIIDSFTLGYGSGIRPEAEKLGNVDIVVVKTDTDVSLEKRIIENYYSGAVHDYQTSMDLMKGTFSVKKEMAVIIGNFYNSEALRSGKPETVEGERSRFLSEAGKISNLILEKGLFKKAEAVTERKADNLLNFFSEVASAARKAAGHDFDLGIYVGSGFGISEIIPYTDNFVTVDQKDIFDGVEDVSLGTVMEKVMGNFSDKMAQGMIKATSHQGFIDYIIELRALGIDMDSLSVIYDEKTGDTRITTFQFKIGKKLYTHTHCKYKVKSRFSSDDGEDKAFLDYLSRLKSKSSHALLLSKAGAIGRLSEYDITKPFYDAGVLPYGTVVVSDNPKEDTYIQNSRHYNLGYLTDRAESDIELIERRFAHGTELSYGYARSLSQALDIYELNSGESENSGQLDLGLDSINNISREVNTAL